MTEPTLASQFLGIATTMFSLFIVFSLIAYGEQKAKAKEELFSASGSLFDPDVVKAFIDVLG